MRLLRDLSFGPQKTKPSCDLTSGTAKTCLGERAAGEPASRLTAGRGTAIPSDRRATDTGSMRRVVRLPRSNGRRRHVVWHRTIAPAWVSHGIPGRRDRGGCGQRLRACLPMRLCLGRRFLRHAKSHLAQSRRLAAHLVRSRRHAAVLSAGVHQLLDREPSFSGSIRRSATRSTCCFTAPRRCLAWRILVGRACRRGWPGGRR